MQVIQKLPTGSPEINSHQLLSIAPRWQGAVFPWTVQTEKKEGQQRTGPRRSTPRRQELPTLPVSSLPRRNTCDRGCPTPASLRGWCASGALFSGERLGLFFLPGGAGLRESCGFPAECCLDLH